MTQTAMQQTPKPRFFTLKRFGIGLGTVLAIVALFGLLGYYWLPGFAKSQLEQRLSELLERPVTVQSIEVKPYTLEFAVTGFRVGERADGQDAGETFLSFDRLYIDISSESITQRAPVISAVVLDTPHLRVTRDDEQTFNFSDLIDKFSQPSEDDEPALFSVGNIVLNDGHIEWIDRYKSNHQSIAEINFAIPFVANLEKVKADWIKPYFSAKINGAPFLLDGRLRPFSQKREATLALKLTDADLENIVSYLPLPGGIDLLSGRLDTDLEVRFSQSSEEDTAITLTGETVLRNIAIRNHTVQIPHQLDLGSFHLSLNQFDLTGQTPSSLVFGLADVALLPLSPLSPQSDSTDAVLSLKRFVVDEVQLNLTGKQVVLNAITLDRLKSVINRTADGGIELLRFFSSDERDGDESVVSTRQNVVAAVVPLPRIKPSSEARLAAAARAKSEADADLDLDLDHEPVLADDEDRPWMVKINQLRLNAAALRYFDQTLPAVRPMTVDPLDLNVTNIDISGDQPLNLEMTAMVNERGRVEASGILAWSPLIADLQFDLDSVDLVALQGWASDALNVVLTNGELSFDGRIQAGGDPFKVTVNGQTQLGNFSLLDPKQARDVLRWKNIDISGLSIISDPLDIKVDKIKLGGFYAYVVLQSDGEINLKQIVRHENAATMDGADAQAESADSKPLPLFVGNILLQQGNIDFHDRFIEPNYNANLTGLSGRIGPIQAGRSGEIDVTGAVDKTAPLAIQGSIEPFGSQLLLDINAKAQEIDLPPFSPYSGKYVGYGIEKGKLSVDVHYHIENGALTAENNVFLDQLTLGERIKSEEAVSLPLELAIALLKNRRGEIDLHLPVKGSMDDPQFSLGGIILDAFVNLITRAVTAPFALLGSMLGQDEQLSEIAFAPGSVAIETKAAGRLETLAQILKERPALRLDITGSMDPVKDYQGLQRVNLQRLVVAQKLADDAKKGQSGGTFKATELTPEEYSKYLEIVYKAGDFEKPTNFLGLTKSLPDQEMEQLLLAHINVGNDQMLELAHDRAVAVQYWLMENGEIASERLFVTGTVQSGDTVDTADNNQGSRVLFAIK